MVPRQITAFFILDGKKEGEAISFDPESSMVDLIRRVADALEVEIDDPKEWSLWHEVGGKAFRIREMVSLERNTVYTLKRKRMCTF